MFKCSSLFVVLQDGKVDQKWKWPLGRLQTTVTVQVCLPFHYIWQQKNSQRNVTQRLEDACIHRRSMQAHASSLVSRASDVIFLEMPKKHPFNVRLLFSNRNILAERKMPKQNRPETKICKFYNKQVTKKLTDLHV